MYSPEHGKLLKGPKHVNGRNLFPSPRDRFRADVEKTWCSRIGKGVRIRTKIRPNFTGTNQTNSYKRTRGQLLKPWWCFRVYVTNTAHGIHYRSSAFIRELHVAFLDRVWFCIIGQISSGSLPKSKMPKVVHQLAIRRFSVTCANKDHFGVSRPRWTSAPPRIISIHHQRLRCPAIQEGTNTECGSRP